MVKKKVRSTEIKDRLHLLDKFDEKMSMRKQCQLLEINRSSLYYEPVKISNTDLGIMRLLDEQYLKTPFYGVLK